VGYLVRGADTVIDALLAVVGERGTVMMPTFSVGDSSYRYATSNPPPFDPQHAPATTGALPERFRHYPGVLRSLHPTHSVAAKGPLAEELLRHHEKSESPFGDATPYARLGPFGGKVLLLNCNANSLMHRTQEEMDWPNHYRAERFTMQVVTPAGLRTVRTVVHSPGFCLKVVLPGRESGAVRLIHMPWYGLQFMFDESEREEYAGLRPDIATELADRQAWFEREGIVRFGPVGYAQAALLDAARFSARIADDLRTHVAANRSLYDPARLESLRKARGAH
jgi:aminoglycoside N3'-acetyltransferase